MVLQILRCILYNFMNCLGLLYFCFFVFFRCSRRSVSMSWMSLTQRVVLPRILWRTSHHLSHGGASLTGSLNGNGYARLTLTLPSPSAGVSGSLDSYCSLKPLCSGMVEVVPARTSPTLLPPSPRTVLSLSCFKVLQCINCRDWHCKS